MVERGGEDRPESEGRRRFLLKMAAVAFAVPVVSSFTLDALSYGAESSAQPKLSNQSFPNQAYPNQVTLPKQHLPNQVPSQQFPNQIRV